MCPEKAPTSWVCPSCYHEVATPFCPGCGERPLDPKQLTLRGLMSQLALYVTSLDTRVINTVRALMGEPGRLTLAFQNGQRMPFLGPFKIFILANVLFFAIQAMSDLRVYATLLEQQVGTEDGTAFARYLVERYLSAKGLAFEEYAPVYDQAVLTNARSMIGLMALPFALCVALLFWRSRRPFAVHIVFSLHFYAFVLLLLCVPAGLIALEKSFGGSLLSSRTGDNILSFMLQAIQAGYLYIAVNRVYEARRSWRTGSTVLLVLAEFFCFLLYRQLLLPITLLMTW